MGPNATIRIQNNQAGCIPMQFSHVPSLSVSPAYSASPLSIRLPVSHSKDSLRLVSKPSFRTSPRTKVLGVRSSLREPLKVMISGAPASGKGTQCQMIVEKFGLVHISTGDLLRAEVSSETEIGKKAKEYMNNGLLVPDEIVTEMVITRLLQKDAKEKGWLLDGYPRSSSQAQSLEERNIRPDLCILLEVPDEVLIDRCIGRRLDPVTGKIYHIKNFPPETDEIKARLVTRPDDTREKVKSRLETYKRNAEAVSSTYLNILKKIDGNCQYGLVFEEIISLLLEAQQHDVKGTDSDSESDSNPGLVSLESRVISNMKSSKQDQWRGIPTRLNNIPHSREIREYFYDDVLQATQRAVMAGRTRLKVEINIPELNPEMDVYRIGTLMELVRVLALSFADDGKHVKVCVQGSMGEGALSGMPLQLAGTRKILEFMDWGNDGAMGTFISIGSIGRKLNG